MTSSPESGWSAAATPRVRLVPDTIADSVGDMACDFAEAFAGLVADPWQRLAVRDHLATRADGRWAAYQTAELVARQNGKGAIVEIVCLGGLHLFGERLIVWSSHLWDTARKMFARMESHYTNNDALRRTVARVNRSHGEEGIELLNGAILKFATRSKSGGRGLSGDRVIIDEAFAHSDEEADALLPVLSARQCTTRRGPQVMYMSSPPLDQVTAKKRDLAKSAGLPLFRLRRRAARGATSLVYRDWGLAGSLDALDGVELGDRALWRVTNPACGLGRMSEEWIREVEYEQMSPEGFARERLGIWPPEPVELGNDLLTAEMWAAIADRETRPGPEVALGVDTTLDRQWSTITLYSIRDDGLGHHEVVDHRPGTEWVVDRLVELIRRHRPVAVGLDPRGPAAALLDDMIAAGIHEPDYPESPEYSDLACPTAPEFAQATGQFVDGVRQQRDRHIDEIRLNTAAGVVATRSLGGSIGWARQVGVVDSPILAATLGRWAYHTRAPLVHEVDPQVLVF